MTSETETITALTARVGLILGAWDNGRHPIDAYVRDLLRDLLATCEALVQERDTLRKQTHTRMRDEINATWDAIEDGFDIEPRAYFEKEAPHNGFRFALVQAIHHLWKRDAKVQALEADLTALRGSLAELMGAWTARAEAMGSDRTVDAYEECIDDLDLLLRGSIDSPTTPKP